MKVQKTIVLGILVSLAAAPAFAQGGGGGACEPREGSPPPFTLPAGFDRNVFVDGLDSLSAIAFDGEGRLYTSRGGGFVPFPDQKVWVVEDLDGDGVADDVRVFAEGFGQALGLVFRPRLPGNRSARAEQQFFENLFKKYGSVHNAIRVGALEGVPMDLYVNHNVFAFDPDNENNGFLTRLRDLNGDGDAMDPGERMDVLTELPSGADHNNDLLAIGPDGKIYFGQGIKTNWGGIGKGPDGTLGVQTCTVEETPLNGTILRVDPDGSNLVVVASGFRNPFGIGFLPDGTLLSTDNGPDNRNCFPTQCVPDELNLVIAGETYGAPFVGGDPPAVGPGSDSVAPLLNFLPSVSADGFDVNLTDRWCGFEGDLFVAQFGNFGSFAPFTQGRRVVRIRFEFEGGKQVADLLPPGRSDHPEPQHIIHAMRKLGPPTGAEFNFFGGQHFLFVDAKFGPDGALYVTEHSSFFTPNTGRVHRIFPVDSDGDGRSDICERAHGEPAPPGRGKGR